MRVLLAILALSISSWGQMLQAVATSKPPASVTKTFSVSQQCKGATTTTSMTCNFTNNPTAGHLVVMAIEGTLGTSPSYTNGASESYTLTPNAASQSGNFARFGYILNASGATNSKNTTISWTGNHEASVWGYDIAVTNGPAVFDTDGGINGDGPGTTINTPAITVAGAGEFMVAVTATGGAVSAPAADATQGVWTGAHGGIDSTTGGMSEFLVNSGTGSIAVNYTSSNNSWYGGEAAFK